MPYLPFARPSLDEATIEAVARVLRSGWITTGPLVARFEAALSDYFNGRTVRSFTSATAALEVALQVAGIGPGDEVITTAMTFAATANVIVRVGATPVFVDVELGTRNIDLAQMEAAITPRTRALMPVHFAGRPVDMDRLYEIARRHGLRVIEDAAHAMGARWGERRIGAFGDMAVFSFHPNKNMTTIEGGALVLDDAAEVRAAELQRFHGIRRTPEGAIDVIAPGGKSNLSDVSAAIGLAQLERIEAFNDQRRALVARYDARLAGSPLALPDAADAGHCWHLYSPLLPLGTSGLTREAFIAAMHTHGIGIGVHYPALHTLTYYRAAHALTHDGGVLALPNAERIGRETVTLPLYADMTAADVDRVCDAIDAVLAQAGASGAADTAPAGRGAA